MTNLVAVRSTQGERVLATVESSSSDKSSLLQRCCEDPESRIHRREVALIDDKHIPDEIDLKSDSVLVARTGLEDQPVPGQDATLCKVRLGLKSGD